VNAPPEPDLPLARPLPPERRPQRLGLRLPDGCPTSVYLHRPVAGAERPPVLYVHGIQSHPGWFGGSAAHLAGAGVAVYMPVRRGSGDSPAPRGDARSASHLMGDVAAACRFVQERASAERLHLVGVSWGGKVLAAYAACGGGAEVASLTLIAPGLAPRVDVPRATKLAVAASLLCCPRRRFELPLNDESLFTDNEEMRAYLRGDGMRLHRATARFLWASRRLDGLIRRAPRGAVAVPTTLILARRDRIIDNAATRSAVERLTGGAARVVELDGAHTLEFEADPTPLYDALAEAVGAATH
jgi:alpha-beta hydrolase superfamily lysophospholipase